MRHINEIIIHCSATPPNMDIGVDNIREWHVKGNGWKDVGYHYVIRRSGFIEMGRSVVQVGAHCLGSNASSIGICLVGGVSFNGKPQDNFTHEQYSALAALLKRLLSEHPAITFITGHNEHSKKDCPCFDVSEFLKKAGIQL